MIGINTAIIPYAQGIGFAIPINTAKEILDDLRTKGKVSRPWLGISMLPIDNEIARYYNVRTGMGVFVQNVLPKSPAQKSGLEVGDIILEINRIKIKSPEHLQKIVSGLKIGSQAKILVFRNNRPKVLTVRIGERPQNIE